MNFFVPHVAPPYSISLSLCVFLCVCVCVYVYVCVCIQCVCVCACVCVRPSQLVSWINHHILSNIFLCFGVGVGFCCCLFSWQSLGPQLEDSQALDALSHDFLAGGRRVVSPPGVSPEPPSSVSFSSTVTVVCVTLMSHFMDPCCHTAAGSLDSYLDLLFAEEIPESLAGWVGLLIE